MLLRSKKVPLDLTCLAGHWKLQSTSKPMEGHRRSPLCLLFACTVGMFLFHLVFLPTDNQRSLESCQHREEEQEHAFPNVPSAEPAGTRTVASCWCPTARRWQPTISAWWDHLGGGLSSWTLLLILFVCISFLQDVTFFNTNAKVLFYCFVFMWVMHSAIIHIVWYLKCE